MNKTDLKTGMRVKLRNNDEFIEIYKSTNYHVNPYIFSIQESEAI